MLPYQLHCCTQDWGDELERLEGIDDEDGREEEVAGAELAALHRVPLRAGISIAAPFLFNWKPKVAVCPGDKLPFQLRLDAE
jgi:hypothetical protein